MSLTPLNEAFERLGENFSPLSTEMVNVADALGRVVSEDMQARVDQPPAPVSSMDGYAVHHLDVAETAQKLEVIGKSQAGGPFEGQMERSKAVRIFTGAVMPSGTDCVMLQEDADVTNGFVSFAQTGREGQFMRTKGMDFSKGDVMIKAGTALNARHMGLLAAMNVPWVKVYRKPNIAILSTGDELIMPGEAKTDFQIFSSNSLMLVNMVEAMGANAINVGIARDTEDSLREHLHGIESYDLFITIGGVSVGDYDLVGQVLGQEGMDLTFYKIAIRPGKPFMHGRIRGTPVMGLPGNPVSAYVTAHIFLRAAIRKMLGLGFQGDRFENAILSADLEKNSARMDFMRCTLSRDEEGLLHADPFVGQDSSLLSVLASADGFIVREIGDPARRKGDQVQVLQIKDSLISV